MSLSDTFKVLSDPLRRNILVSLKNGRLTAGELSKNFNITPAALSYHLKLLRKADVIMEYKYKNLIYYELNTTVFNELIMWIKELGEKNEK